MYAKTLITPKALIALGLSAALAGCVSFGAKTPDTLLSLRSTNAPAANGVGTAIDPTATDPQRFYRVGAP